MFSFLLPAVQAATVSDVGLEFNDAPIEYLAPGASFTADFVFNTQGEDLNCEEASCQAVLEFNGEEFQFGLAECEFNESYSCSREVLIDSLENTYSLLIFSQGLVADDEGIITLTEDNTTPVLAELTTGLCQGETCYVGSNAQTPVQARFEDELTAFEQKLVRFAIGGASQHAQSCEGKTCEAIVRTSSCVDGSTVEVSVVNFFAGMPSSEDARNAVDNSLTIQAVCDASDPVIENFAIRSGGPVPAVFETASPLEIQATITDMAGGTVELAIESENLTDEEFRAECSETNNGDFVCDTSVRDLNQGQHDIIFRFLDGVGNSVEEERTIIVLESVDQNETDLVDLRVTDITPQPMNRVALQLAMENAIHYPILIDYVLMGDATVVGQSLQNLECVWDNKTITNESSNRNLFSLERSSILKPNADVNEENRFIFNFHTAAGELPNVVYTKCEYDVFVAQDNQFFATPEREEIELTLTFKNSVLGAPGEAFVEEIKRAEGEIDGGAAKALEMMNKVGGYADTICGGYYTLASVDALATTLQSSQFFRPIGDAINTPMEGIFATIGDSPGDAKHSAFVKATGGDIPARAPDDVAFGMLPQAFTLHSMCSWWTCKDAAQADGFLGPLSCNNINTWMAEGQSLTSTSDGEPQGRSELPANQVIVGGASTGVDLEVNEATDQMKDYGASYISNPFDPAGYESLTQGDYCAPRYEDSLLTSMGLTGTGFCAKGVMYNLGKWHGIDCGYVSCLKEQSELGANINVCKQARDFKQCTQVTGEIFQLPIINVFTRTSSLVNANVQDIGFNMLNSGLSAYCSPGEEIVKQMTNEIVNQLLRSALDAATSGVYSAVMESLRMLDGLINFINGPVKGINAIAKGTPTTADSGKLVCNLRDSFYRLSEVNAMRNGGLAFSVADTTSMCDAARCNGPDCDRSGLTTSFLESATRLGLLIAGEKGGDVTHEERQAAAIRRAYYDGYSGLFDQEMETTYENLPEGVSKSKVRQGVESLINSQDAGRVAATAVPTTDPLNPNQDSEVFQDLRAAGYSDEEATQAIIAYNRVTRVASDMRITTNENGDLVAQFGENTKAITVSSEVQEAFKKQIGAEGELTHDQVAALAKAQEECQGCSAEEVAQRAEENPVQNTDLTRPDLGTSQDLIDTWDEVHDTGLSQQEKTERLRENCPEGYTCEYTNADALRIKKDGVNCDSTPSECYVYDDNEIRNADVSRQATIKAISLAVDFAVKWAYDQGYLNNLKFSSWGDWGAESAQRADKLFNPDSWSRNLCSNEIEILTNDDPLTGLATTTGPVLTFAAEIRELNESYIYTISYFIRNGDEEYHQQNGGGDNKVWLKLDNQDFNWTQNATEGVSLDQGEELTGGLSFNRSERFEELCVVFDDPFPDNLGNRRFCREIVGDAFAR